MAVQWWGYITVTVFQPRDSCFTSWMKFLLLTTQKERKLSYLGEMGYKKTKVNYSMIIITSSIIKNYNNQIWDEPKEYFKHHQAQGKGIIESRQNADLNLLSQTKLLFGLSGKTTEKTMSVFFCSCCDGSSSLSHHLSKRNSNICSLQA